MFIIIKIMISYLLGVRIGFTNMQPPWIGWLEVIEGCMLKKHNFDSFPILLSQSESRTLYQNAPVLDCRNMENAIQLGCSIHPFRGGC